jgi:hypothetical protein
VDEMSQQMPQTQSCASKVESLQFAEKRY